MSNFSEVIRNIRDQGRTFLTEVESKELLKNAGIPTTAIMLAKSEDEAAAAAGEIGYPVVLKIASLDVVHKSDSGGVKLGLKNAGEVRKAYREILASVEKNVPHARIDGVSVQNMAKPGVEVIIGMVKDPQFGPVLMFGLGGIWVEVIQDVAFRIVPLTRNDAEDMLKEIKGYALLKGFRGSEPVDLKTLENLLLKLSDLINATSGIKEMDLNPVFAYKHGALVVDARIILET